MSTESPVMLGDLLGCGLAEALLPEVLGDPDDAGEIGGAVEGHADGAAVACDRGEDRLADPPDRVRDELDAVVGIELPGRGEETHVPLADQVHQRDAPVLVLLRHRDHETEVALDQLLHGELVAGLDPAGDGDFLGLGEERSERNLVQVLVEDVTVGLVDTDGASRWSGEPAASAWSGERRR